MRIAITATAAVLLLLFVCPAEANEGPPPAITPETLVGVWEAAPSWARRVYRLDIARRGDSYLAFTYGSENLVFRLTSSTVNHGKLVLRFTSLRDRGRGCNDLVITGSGTAFGDFGTFASTLRMYDPPYGTDHPESSTVRLSFTKPPWTRDLTRWSKESEKLIPKTRTSRDTNGAEA